MDKCHVHLFPVRYVGKAGKAVELDPHLYVRACKIADAFHVLQRFRDIQVQNAAVQGIGPCVCDRTSEIRRFGNMSGPPALVHSGTLSCIPPAHYPVCARRQHDMGALTGVQGLFVECIFRMECTVVCRIDIHIHAHYLRREDICVPVAIVDEMQEYISATVAPVVTDAA